MAGMAENEKVNVLLVDDQPAKLLSYEEILKKANDSVIELTLASQARERQEQERRNEEDAARAATQLLDRPKLDELLAALNPWKAMIIPTTVPNNPMKGEALAVVASQDKLRSSAVTSSIVADCSTRPRASATRISRTASFAIR